jgi:hypothetical protein
MSSVITTHAWRQIGMLTLGAVALYLGFRALPTGTNLHHLDFRVAGKGALEMCDPANPQFIPVIAARSPVTLTLRGGVTVTSGEEMRGTLALATASGKPIAPNDLVVAHTRKLHLLIVDATLQDYQHVHPEAGAVAGEWTFNFTPHRAGLYRVFADFTPAATGRSLYASTDFMVAGPLNNRAPETSESWLVEVEDYRYQLTPDAQPIRAGKVAALTFAVTRRDGGAVPMQPVMDALAHLVAFDESRSGFAHLHPGDPQQTLDPVNPRLAFKITIPEPGRYVIWAQVNLGGRERFVPFRFEVQP